MNGLTHVGLDVGTSNRIAVDGVGSLTNRERPDVCVCDMVEGVRNVCLMLCSQ